MDKNQPKWDKKYSDKQRSIGMTQVQVWVPADRALELREIARKMRADHHAAEPCID